jgi:hypothetical protein
MRSKTFENFTPLDPGTPDSPTLHVTRLSAGEAAARILDHCRRSSP